MSLRMDDGRSVELDSARHPHRCIDHGYAVTSHSSQGQTAERVLVHVDTELGAKDLLNNRMAYVAVSRGAQDAQLFTNDREKLQQECRSTYSGAIQGRPWSEYSASNSALKDRSTSSVSLRIARSGWYWGTTLLQRNIAEHPVLEPLISTHIQETNLGLTKS